MPGLVGVSKREWIEYLQHELQRRDSQQRFMWSLALGCIAAAWLLFQFANLSVLSSSLSAIAVGLVTAAIVYTWLGSGLVSRIEATQKTSVVSDLSILRSLVLTKYVKRFGMPLSWRLGSVSQALLLIAVGAACIADGKGMHGNLATTLVVDGWVLSILGGLDLLSSLLASRRFIASVIAKFLAEIHRQARGMSAKAADAVPGLNELRKTSSWLLGPSWKDARQASLGMLFSSRLKIFQHLLLLTALLTLIFFNIKDISLSELRQAMVIATLSMLLLLAAGLALSLYRESARQQVSQLLFAVMRGNFPLRAIPLAVGLINVLNELGIRSRFSFDIIWKELEMQKVSANTLDWEK